MYSVGDYGDMADNEVRRVAYHRALASAVAPGSVVVELGTGAGLMALLACRLGARRVYAIEPSDAIEVARALARDNGLADRIVFVQDYSRNVSLPERADILLEDIRGLMPWFGRHLPDLIDARRRFLKPGGVIISSRDTALCAVVEAEGLYEEITGPWKREPQGLDLSAGLRYVLNAFRRHRPDAAQLLTAEVPWAEIDYRTIESADARGDADFEVTRPGTGHGLVLWFDGQLAPGVVIPNGPGRPRTPYGSMFLPWPEPVTLAPGDRVTVRLRADLLGEDYVWTWKSEIVRRPDGRGSPLRFEQSTFAGAPLTRQTLSRREAQARPRLGPDGEAARFVLDRLDGKTTLADIADELASQPCGRFASPREALDFVARLSGLYGA